VDFMKALAIVAVVMTHAGPMAGTPRYDRWDELLRHSWVSFHVPSFLVISGLLYARSAPIALTQVGRRLTRVLVPYLIASGVLWASGWVRRPGDVAEALFRLATGSALGIYYFLFLLVLCIALIWPLSRARPAWIVATLAALVVYYYAFFDAARGLFPGLFWGPRDPLRTFAFGYFLVGWLAALWLPRLTDLYERHRAMAGLLCIAGIGVWIASLLVEPPVRRPARPVYTFAVMGLVMPFTAGWRVSRPVQLLSEASLTIYLYHHLFQLIALRHTLELPAALRVLTLTALGLAGGAAVALLGRRLLGSHWSRRLLGA
jgi:fucose 4-O-acetylase-like acetyltransferase